MPVPPYPFCTLFSDGATILVRTAYLNAEDVALRLERFLMKAGPAISCWRGLLAESSRGSKGI